MIPQEYIFELTQRSNVVDVVQNYVQLRQRGRTHTGLCPFHNEKTPSFVVYPDTQSFYCFGCGAGGDVIGFTKRINNIDYVEAVKLLASRAGMKMPDEDDTAGKLRARLTTINKEAARFFFQTLNSEEGKAARIYWRGRGLSDANIRKFGLGYAPDDFHRLRDAFRANGYTDEELIAAGVCKRSEKGSVYDVFRNRVMIPIFDLRGNVIAFSGRNLGDEKPKYLNSPETMLYKKSKTLFLLNFAKKEPSKRYLLCEGNLDAISLHQAGFCTAVAGCGTALTSDQVKLLSDYAEEVVLCYDGDEAGQKATTRAIELLSQSALKVSVLTMPDAKDPDEFIKKFGAERFAMLLDGSGNAIEFALAKAKAKYNLATEDGRVGYLKDAATILAGRLTDIERDVYAGRLAEEVGAEKRSILNQVQAFVKANQRRAAKDYEKRLLEEGAGARINVPYSQGGQKALGVAFAEQQIVGALIQNPSYLSLVKPALTPEMFLSADMSRAYAVILEKAQLKEYFDFSAITQELPDEVTRMLSRILAQNHDVTISAQDVAFYLERIQTSVPQSTVAADKSEEELAAYIANLRTKKEK